MLLLIFHFLPFGCVASTPASPASCALLESLALLLPSLPFYLHPARPPRGTSRACTVPRGPSRGSPGERSVQRRAQHHTPVRRPAHGLGGGPHTAAEGTWPCQAQISTDAKAGNETPAESPTPQYQLQRQCKAGWADHPVKALKATRGRCARRAGQVEQGDTAISETEGSTCQIKNLS